MEVREALIKRRSIRNFTEQKVERELVEELMQAAMSGPSACNMCPWEFYVITNEEKLTQLREAARFSNISAPNAIVVCGDLEKSLPEPISEFWVQDCSAATENILLRVTDLGLGAVWCGIHPQKRSVENVQRILDLPQTVIPLNIIYFGYPDRTANERVQYDSARVHYVD